MENLKYYQKKLNFYQYLFYLAIIFFMFTHSKFIGEKLTQQLFSSSKLFINFEVIRKRCLLCF